MPTAQETLDAIGQLPDAELDLADAALHLGRIDAPDADWQAARAHLTALAQDAAAMPGALAAPGTPADLPGRAHALALMLAGRHGYQGDAKTYEDPANVNLIRVTERRRGLPVSLGILWLHCARVAGWDAHGVDFPGHFLLALTEGRPAERHAGRHLIISPFAGGATLDLAELRTLAHQVEGPDAVLRPGLLRPMTPRDVLLRLQNNIRARRLQAKDLVGALDCVRTMLRIAPDAPALWQDSALLCEKLEQPADAIRAWERFLALVPEGDVADRAQAAVDALRARLH